jgi:hypothetical protein
MFNTVSFHFHAGDLEHYITNQLNVCDPENDTNLEQLIYN